MESAQLFQTPPFRSRISDDKGMMTQPWISYFNQGYLLAGGPLAIDLSRLTATVDELNVLDGITSSTAELNKVDGYTGTAANLNFVSGVIPGTRTFNKAIVVDNTGTVDFLSVVDFTATNMSVTFFSVSNLIATTGTIGTLSSSNATITSLTTTTAGITTANITTANTTTDNITTANITTLNHQEELINPIINTEPTVGQAGLAGGGSVILKDSSGSKRYKVRHIFLSAVGTNFSGGGGDRDLDIQDSSGTSIYTTIPAATLQALTNSGWGSAEVPYTNDALDATVAGEDLVAKYSGGTTDYTAGSLTLRIELEKTA